MPEELFAAEIAIITELRRITSPIPNIVGPAFGAALCDKAMTVNKVLFTLEICMADADNTRVSEPLSHEEPGLYQLRAALRRQVKGLTYR